MIDRLVAQIGRLVLLYLFTAGGMVAGGWLRPDWIGMSCGAAVGALIWHAARFEAVEWIRAGEAITFLFDFKDEEEGT